jgi:hypothetical protein
MNSESRKCVTVSTDRACLRRFPYGTRSSTRLVQVYTDLRPADRGGSAATVCSAGQQSTTVRPLAFSLWRLASLVAAPPLQAQCTRILLA